ncbi:MAG TPA: glycosyltransferase family 4 protein [Longimicrobiales bacterium]|nr:glycosyltransferase family 4 protein [Longimicrobiales bacterium]
MRVLITTDTIGGVWSYAVELSRGLGVHGVVVELATFGPPPRDAQRAEIAQLSNVRLHPSTFRLEWMEDPWDDVARGSEWLLDLERAVRPDVVHLNEYARGALPWNAPAVVVAHSCVTSWWHCVRGCDPPPAFERYRREVAAGLAAATRVVAPTRAMLDALRRHYGAGESARVIYNGRDPFRPRAPRKEPFVLAAGRVWDEAKNIAALDRIAGDLAWPVFVAGDQTDPEGRRISLRHVHPLGFLPAAELVDWFERASIYALPAKYEPFGLSALEAAIAGCALVLGDIPSLRELWSGAALFVPPDDDGAIRNAIAALIEDPAKLENLARAARQRAALYSTDRMTSAYVDLYQEIRRP